MKTTFLTNQENIDICTKSSYMQREGKENYFYTYLHLHTDNQVFYVGQGSHNRAYKYKGRSKKWYEEFEKSDIIVQIIESELTFEQSLIREKELIEQYKNTIINEDFGHSPKESFPVFMFNKEKTLIKSFENCKQVEEILGYSSIAISQACSNNKRKTMFGYIWCYQKDYETQKDILFNRGKTSSKKVSILFPDGEIKNYSSINETKKDGFLPAKVREVCLGNRKSHKNCKCYYTKI